MSSIFLECQRHELEQKIPYRSKLFLFDLVKWVFWLTLANPPRCLFLQYRSQGLICVLCRHRKCRELNQPKSKETLFHFRLLLDGRRSSNSLCCRVSNREICGKLEDTSTRRYARLLESLGFCFSLTRIRLALR